MPGLSPANFTAERMATRWFPVTRKVIDKPGRAAKDGGMMIYADDLHTGQEFTFSPYTMSEAEIVEYARQWDPVFIHADPEAARAGPLGGVVASGLHTLAIYQRLVVQALWSRVASGAGRSFDVQFRRPVRPGTTLSGRAVVETVTPRPERGDAVVVLTSQLADENGEAVLRVSVDSVLPLRAGASSAAASP